ncbi:hypothetical protein Mapa_015365 [Marchantia paleacea]|nr:hypothetical protein Mapa_015365 [Marchantia paleacea]
MFVIYFARWILNLQITDPVSIIVFTLILLIYIYIIECIHKSRGPDLSPADLRTGDHICTLRGARKYYHHGIYEGDGTVIHYTNIDDSSSLNLTPSSPWSSHSRTSKGRSVQRTSLSRFLGSGTLYRFEYGVPKSEFDKCLSGGCSGRQAQDPEIVLRNSRGLLEADGFGTYHWRSHNCEDFAIFCKTNKFNQEGMSTQVASLLLVYTACRIYFSAVVRGNKFIFFRPQEAFRLASDERWEKDSAGVSVSTEELIKMMKI